MAHLPTLDKEKTTDGPPIHPKHKYRLNRAYTLIGKARMTYYECIGGLNDKLVRVSSSTVNVHRHCDK